MKFLVKCLNDGKEEFWHYDNLTNTITKPDGSDPYQSLKSQKYITVYPAAGKDTRFKFTGSVLGIYIVLGLKCNFHCKYCQQTDVPKDILDEASPKKVKKFVNDLVHSGINIEHNIVFWGGEPLVYWKTLKLLIPALREHYPKLRFSIQTNGSLLDDEKYDFLNQYDVDIGISYDGHHTFRDYSIFDDPKVCNSTQKALDKHYKISILPTITKNSDNTFEIKRDLFSKFNHHIGVGHYSIVRCTADDSSFIEYAKIPQEKLDEMYKQFYEHFHKSPEDIEYGCKDRLDELRGSIAYGIPANSLRTACSVSLGRILCLDINGNVLLCMNMPLKRYGHVSKWKSIQIDTFYHPLTKEKCRNCPYLCACFGLCPLIKDELSEAFKVNCANYTPYARAMMEAAIDSLYGVRVLEFIPESNDA